MLGTFHDQLMHWYFYIFPKLLPQLWRKRTRKMFLFCIWLRVCGVCYMRHIICHIIHIKWFLEAFVLICSNTICHIQSISSLLNRSLETLLQVKFHRVLYYISQSPFKEFAIHSVFDSWNMKRYPSLWYFTHQWFFMIKILSHYLCRALKKITYSPKS